jgi:hypothetical protein
VALQIAAGTHVSIVTLSAAVRPPVEGLVFAEPGGFSFSLPQLRPEQPHHGILTAF